MSTDPTSPQQCAPHDCQCPCHTAGPYWQTAHAAACCKAPAEPTVVRRNDLRPGDEIVGIQRHGESDTLSPRRDRIVEVGAGEHPIIGGECIQLRPVHRGHDLNYWNGTDYLDETLFHVIRGVLQDTGPDTTSGASQQDSDHRQENRR